MPTCITKFTFPADLTADAKMARLFLKYVSDYATDQLLEAHGSDTVDVEFVNKVIGWLKTEDIGGDDDDKSGALYDLVDQIQSTPQLAEMFGFIIIDEKWYDEGSDRHYYLRYMDTKDAVDKAINEINERVALLEKYGKSVSIVIE